ncbi:hypothetical protein NLG97_g3855 [Lecanicillium saksenae]|uniref:Uncharacterized protein n=1 Tax=Lecanicillium saksenae TaxID=468837 RepID=A0ACC1QZL2_9HYPO|nr:hypothetical protein NLG97_g3855 [Lecanicillium saksenae]
MKASTVVAATVTTLLSYSESVAAKSLSRSANLVSPNAFEEQGWQHQGCYVDVGRTISDVISSDGGMTNAKCTDFCFKRGFVYAATEYFSECYCGNIVARGAIAAKAEDCDTQCSGNSTEACGGRNRLTLYKTSKVIPPAVNPGIGDWESMGCHVEGSTGRALERQIWSIPGGNMTAPQCMRACDAGGYALAGVEYGRECFCGNELKNWARPATFGGCTKTCSGNLTEYCGGSNRLNLYQNKLRYKPPLTTSLPTPTTTTDIGTTTTPTACPNQPATIAKDWKLDGCYTEGNKVRALSERWYADNEMTLDDCSRFCTGFAYFGLEYGRECYCGNSFKGGAVKTSASECSMICPGGQQCDYCGAGNRLSVYQNAKIDPSGSSSSVTSTSSTYMTSSTSSHTSSGTPSSVSTTITSSLTSSLPITGLNSTTTTSKGVSTSVSNSTLASSSTRVTSTTTVPITTTSLVSSTSISNLSSSATNSSVSTPVPVTNATTSLPLTGTNSTSSTAPLSSETKSTESSLNSTASTAASTPAGTTASATVSSIQSPSSSLSWSNSTTGPLATSGWNTTQTRLPPPPPTGSTSGFPSIEPTVGPSTQHSETPTRSYPGSSASSTGVPPITTVIGTRTVTVYPTNTTAPTSSNATTASSTVSGSSSSPTGNPSLGTSTNPVNSTASPTQASTTAPLGTAGTSSSASSIPQVTGTSSILSTAETTAPTQLSTPVPPFRNTTTGWHFTNTTSLPSSSQNSGTGVTSATSAPLTTGGVPLTTGVPLTSGPSTFATNSSVPLVNSTTTFTAATTPVSSNSTQAPTSSVRFPNTTSVLFPNTSTVLFPNTSTTSTTATFPATSAVLNQTTSVPLNTSSTTTTSPPFLNSTTSFIPTSTSSPPFGNTTTSNTTTAIGSVSTPPFFNTTTASTPLNTSTTSYSSLPVSNSTTSTSPQSTPTPPFLNTTSAGPIPTTSGLPSNSTTQGTVLTTPSASVATNSSSSSSTTSTPTPTSLWPRGWDHFGCWVDGVAGRILDKQLPDSEELTLELCALSCDAAGFTVAGAEYHSQCFCGNHIVNGGAKAKSKAECDTPCSGNSTQSCGGGNRMSIMSLGEPKIQQPPSTIQRVGNWKYEGCYEDNANQTHVFFWQSFFPDVMTPKMCLDKCAEYGYMAAGLEYGQECYCGDPQNIVVKKSIKKDEKECNVPCVGNSSAICGGGNRLSTYFWDAKPFYSWDIPEEGSPKAGSYDFLIGGTNIPLITSQAINGKITFLEKFGTGPPNSTGAYELDLSEIDNWDKAWRTMHVKTDVFCAAGLTLPDKAGRQINIGGWSGASLHGVRLYSPDGTAGVHGKNDWEEDVNTLRLQDGRWYPTAMNMANGSILIIGGEEGSNSAPVPTLEILPYTGSKPLHMDWLERTDPNNLYPFAAVMPSGGILVIYWNEARILDENTFETVKTLPIIPGAVNDPKGGRTYPLEGSSVLLPQHAPYTDPLGVLICGGSTLGLHNALDNCVSTYPDAPSPKWELERMPSPRVMSCMAPLPDGTFVILNGAHHGVAGFGLGVDPNTNALLYDPKKPLGHRITIMANTTVARLYHSEAITLLDGRVLVSGSDPQDGVNPQEYRIETFTPPYLLSGKPRPKFTVKNTDWSYGQKVTVELGGAAVNGDITMSLLGSVASTHGNSMGARTLFPEVSCSGTSCTVTAPPGKYIAPPGWYQFFVLDGGIPAVGVFVRIGGDPAGLGDWPKDDSFTRPGV